MLRVRNVPLGGGGDDDKDPYRKSQSPFHTTTTDRNKTVGSHRRNESEKSKTGSNNNKAVVLFLSVAVCLTIMTFLIPNDNVVKQEAEFVANKAVEAERELEKEMMQWWSNHGRQQPPIQQVAGDSSESQSDARANRMDLPESSWVEGESMYYGFQTNNLVSIQHGNVQLTFCLSLWDRRKTQTKTEITCGATERRKRFRGSCPDKVAW